MIKLFTRNFNVTGRWPIEVRTDGDLSFKDFIRFVQAKGTAITPSAPYTHEQNGVAEVSGHIIMQGARALMIAAPNAPPFLWPEACVCTTYILNRIHRPGQEQSPLEKWNDRLGLRKTEPFNLGFLRVWYSKAYVHIPKEQRTQARKMAPRA